MSIEQFVNHDNIRNEICGYEYIFKNNTPVTINDFENNKMNFVIRRNYTEMDKIEMISCLNDKLDKDVLGIIASYLYHEIPIEYQTKGYADDPKFYCNMLFHIKINNIPVVFHYSGSDKPKRYSYFWYEDKKYTCYFREKDVDLIYNKIIENPVYSDRDESFYELLYDIINLCLHVINL